MPGARSDPIAQMFCAPLRSDMKYSPFRRPPHIGHASLAPPFVICCKQRAARARDHPDLAFVEVTVPFAPPLRSGIGPRGDRNASPAGGRSGEIFGGVPIRRDCHRRAAVGTDAVDVEHSRNVVAGRQK